MGSSIVLSRETNDERMKYPATNALLIIGISFIVPSCVDHDIRQAVPVKGDYFPMAEGNRWEYVTKYHCPGADGAAVCYDTVRYSAEGDALYWGDDSYKSLSTPYGPFMWIKRSNNEYYAWGAYVPEYKFLDAGLPLHSSWAYDDWGKREFSLIAVNDTKKVYGIVYKNVIGVLQTESWMNDNGEFVETSRAYHYYAKNIGEIYAYYPDPPTRYNGEMEVFLIDHIISQ